MIQFLAHFNPFEIRGDFQVQKVFSLNLIFGDVAALKGFAPMYAKYNLVIQSFS